MKKSLIYIVLLFSLFFSHQYFVKADSFAYSTIINSANQETGNLSPAWISMNANSQNQNNLNVGLMDPDHSSGSPFYQGERFKIVSKWCVSAGGGTWSMLRGTAGLNIQVNDFNISRTYGSCTFTDSGGNVFVGAATITTTVDFTLTKVSLNPHVMFKVSRVNADTGNPMNFSVAFLSYSILQGEEVSNYNNTQDIINSNAADTQSIIDNNNANTDRIVNAQNGTTTAVNNNTTAVNNMNSNMTSTNTSGSESFLTDIINDPAFQDNTGINGIIQLPLAMVSSLSNSCESVNLHIPFLNVDTQLPCIRQTIYNKMPGVANLIFIAVNGFVLYRILIDIVGLIKSARNPDEDRLDVLEL